MIVTTINHIGPVRYEHHMVSSKHTCTDPCRMCYVVMRYAVNVRGVDTAAMAMMRDGRALGLIRGVQGCSGPTLIPTPGQWRGTSSREGHLLYIGEE